MSRCMALLMILIFKSILFQERLVCYLNFETRPESKSKAGTIRVIIDKSGYDNNGDFSLGGEILKYSDKDFTCNQAARLWESDILFKGDLFQAKPRKAITIAAWIRLEEKPGQHSIFDTIGVSHNQGQYHFEVNDGIVRWFHRNENRITVFETMAHSVQKGENSLDVFRILVVNLSLGINIWRSFHDLQSFLIRNWL